MTATNSIAKGLGLAAGVALAVMLLISWRVSSPAGTPGAEVTFVTMPPGELTVSPPGPLMRGVVLRPGGRGVSGQVRLTNIGGRRLPVRVRLAPSNPDLDRLLRVELRVGGLRLAEGTLGELRRWSRRATVIGVGRAKTLTAKARLADRTGAAGRLVDVTVELRAAGGGGRR